jgi:glycosyltransferase involved in cell wall biosynthesis
MNKLPITVIVPVKNEAKVIKNCLNKLGVFDQVIVVDSNSTDGTKSIVLDDFKYEYHNFNWNGFFPKKRNWALENLFIKNDFVLFLDADEILTEEFIREIGLILSESDYVGYWLYYENYFLNKKLNYGVSMKKLALFNKNFGKYEIINDNNWSNFDMEIHEHPILKGKTSHIKSRIIHNDFKDINHFILKHNEYANWEARRYINLSNIKLLTFRQKLKYLLLPRAIFAVIYFIYNYFVRMGFLDGKRGFIYSSLKSIYFFLISIKIYELKLESKKTII